MKRLKTIANDLLELAENIEEWDKFVAKIKNPEEDDKMQAILNDRNEFITKLLLLDLETRFQYSERPSKAQAKWFKDNWGLSENTLDFYRNRKSKSIAKQYSELENKGEEFSGEDDTENVNIEEPTITEVNAEYPTVHQIKEIAKDNAALEEDSSSKKLETMNKRSTEDNVWDDITYSDLCLLKPQWHEPFQYGDIMEDGKVFVWKNKFVDKETFFKSYTKSKTFLEKKHELKLSVSDIIKKTGLPRHIVNSAIYYPYIKIDDMLVEQFQRKFDEIV